VLLLLLAVAAPVFPLYTHYVSIVFNASGLLTDSLLRRAGAEVFRGSLNSDTLIEHLVREVLGH
jgi:hypothetical protein